MNDTRRKGRKDGPSMLPLPNEIWFINCSEIQFYAKCKRLDIRFWMEGEIENPDPYKNYTDDDYSWVESE